MSFWIEGPPQKPGVYECEVSVVPGFRATIPVFFDGHVGRRLETASEIVASSIARHRRLEVVLDETPIVTPTPEPFRVTEPGWYRTRDGRKAKVVCVGRPFDPDCQYPVFGWVAGVRWMRTWARSGEAVLGRSRPGDLVAKWIDEPAVPPRPPALELFLIHRNMSGTAGDWCYEATWANQEWGQYFAFNGEAGERVVFSKDKGWRRVSEKEQP